MMKLFRKFARVHSCVGMLSMAAGCAIGVTHDYGLGDTTLNVSSAKSVTVAVHDLRPYVVNGSEPANFVGLSRGGYYNSFNVVTALGKPLAVDMMTAIAAGLEARKIKVRQVTLSAKDKPSLARSRLIGTERALLIELLEWKADTYIGTRLLY